MLVFYHFKVLFKTHHSTAPSPLQMTEALFNSRHLRMETSQEERKLLVYQRFNPLCSTPRKFEACISWLADIISHQNLMGGGGNRTKSTLRICYYYTHLCLLGDHKSVMSRFHSSGLSHTNTHQHILFYSNYNRWVYIMCARVCTNTHI